MSEEPADDQLRAHIRASLATARISQAEAARQLGLSGKHLSQMLTGRATLSLTWAEGLLGLCGMRLVIGVQPDEEQPPTPPTPCTCRQAVHTAEHKTPVAGCPWCTPASTIRSAPASTEESL